MSLLLFVIAAVAYGHAAPPINIRITTDAGTITAELYPDRAPATVANFLRYVDGGFYDGGRFHRTVRPDNQPTDSVKIGVIQAGVDPTRARAGFPAIPLERTTTTGLRHEDGTLSMARSGPDSATSDFFICIGAQPELDFAGRRNRDGQGFAAFGRVTGGMDVVRRIQEMTADRQRLTPPVRIIRIERIPPADDGH